MIAFVGGRVEFGFLGQPAQYTFAASPNGMYLNLGYDPQTQALNDVKTTEAGQPESVATQDELSYHYNGTGVSSGAGLVASIVDAKSAGATVDTQCFTYDYAQRLSQAWTATDGCGSTPAPGNSPTVGGQQPYWQSWTYDAAGDRATQTDHDTTGKTAKDTTTTYHYPAPGSSNDQPHTLTNTTATGPNAAQDTQSFGYDPDGNTKSITAGAKGSGDQSLTYNDQNQLASDVTTSGNTTYVYDSSGNLLVRRNPGTTTLFLGDAELTQNTATGALSGTRYYTLGGQAIAARTNSANPQILIPDRQGTDQLAIDTATDNLTRQQFLPFGQTRGTPPTTWAGGDKGYVGGTPDPTTTLENLGAREYDPTTGRFLTADPEFEDTSPTQMGGYDYAGNNPTTGSDPTGLHDPAADGHPGLANCEQTGSAASCTEAGVPATSSEAIRDAIKENITNSRNNLAAQLKSLEDLRSRLAEEVKQLNECAGSGDDQCIPAVEDEYNPPTLHDYLDILDLIGTSFFEGGECGEDVASGDPSDCPEDGSAIIDAAGNVLKDAKDYLSYDPSKLLDDADAAISADSQQIGVDNSALSILNGCGNSFVAGTEVLMADGTSEPIQQVKIGDKITNAEPDSPTPVTDTVIAVHVTYTDQDYDELTIATPGGRQTIASTAGHLYWDATTSSWTEADNINIGDKLDTPGNGSVTVAATRHYTTQQITYNLTIESTHTYYVVAGTTAVLVHNAPLACVAKGRAGEARAINDLQQKGYGIVGTQISVRTSAANVRLDIVAVKDGKFYLFDVKNGTKAGFTKNQGSGGGYNAIESIGGSYYGKNASTVDLLGDFGPQPVYVIQYP